MIKARVVGLVQWQCPKCFEDLADFESALRHLVDAHGEDEELAANECWDAAYQAVDDEVARKGGGGDA